MNSVLLTLAKAQVCTSNPIHWIFGVEISNAKSIVHIAMSATSPNNVNTVKCIGKPYLVC